MAHKVILEKVDSKLLNKHLKDYKLPTKGSLEERVTALHEYVVTQAKAKKLEPVQCDVCEGISDAALSVCPYCGDASEAEPEAEAEEVEQAEEAEAEVEIEDEDEPAQKPVKAAKTAKAAKGKAVAEAKVEKPSKPAKAAKTPAAEIVPVKVTKAEIAKAADLDAQCEKVRTLQVAVADSMWLAGQALTRIHDKELWKMRREEGVPVHVSFRRFVQDELGISHTYAYQLMEVSKNFTEAEVKKIGVNKLRIALLAPPEKRPEVLEAAAGGASNPQLNAMTGRKERTGVTVAMMLGVQTLPAYSRTRTEKDGTPMAARKVQEDPWCEVKLENNVKMLIKVTADPTGELRFIVEVSKDQAAKAVA